MHEVSQRGAAPTQHRSGRNPGSASWDDLHRFLVCARHGSFRRAAGPARRQQHHADAQGRAARGAARQPAVPARLQTGLVLTDEGQDIARQDHRDGASSFDVYRRAAKSAANLTGTVRVAVTEGPGIFWILPRLIDFQNTYRQLIVDLRCAMEPADVARLEADIAHAVPEADQSRSRSSTKIGRMHIYPFASEGYRTNSTACRSLTRTGRTIG